MLRIPAFIYKLTRSSMMLLLYGYPYLYSFSITSVLPDMEFNNYYCHVKILNYKQFNQLK